MKILLIEDNKQIAENIRIYLQLENMEVLICDDGEKGLFLGKTNDYDAIILDLMLPSIDGKTICKTIRKEKMYQYSLLLQNHNLKINWIFLK